MRTFHPVPVAYTIKPMDDLEPTGWAWWRDEAIDQGAHALAAAVVVTLAIALGASIPPLAGMLIGMSLGWVREITEGGNVVSDGSLTDVCFWTLGGLLATVVAW